tara:strand:+ start:101 stop:559 length:459 start_codon:yes stop_codon:yes gene_type:complete
MEINNYPNYLIYEDGGVWSKPRRKTKGGFLKQMIDKDGYKRIHLNNKNGKKNFSVHRLVAEHYIPNPENKPVVDHINHIINDNKVENLRWATYSQNTLNTDKVKPNTGFTYIHDDGKYSWIIRILKLGYHKRYSKSKYTLEEVIFMRDMILN